MAQTDLAPSSEPETVRATRSVQRSGWLLARPFGIPIVADYSLLLIFALIATNLGAAVFPAWHPRWEPWLVWIIAICAALLFFASVAVHELCHALVARARGMPVRRIQLFVFGGLAEIEGEPPSARAEFWMAIVGPIASLVLALASGWLGMYLALSRVDPEAVLLDPGAVWRNAGPFATLLLWLAPVNFFLGVFNLVPGFPLDGGRVLRSLIWWITGNLRKATRIASAMGQAFAWLLMSVGVFMVFGYAFPILGGGAGQGLWLLLIGWFLNNAARASFQQVLLQQALEDVTVRDVMRSRVETVDPALSLSELVRDFVMNTDQTSFPVVRGANVMGMIRTSDVRSVPRERWDEVQVADAMIPVTQLHVVAPEEPALEALRHLADHDPVPVVDHDRFIGVARRDDVIKWLALHSPQPA